MNTGASGSAVLPIALKPVQLQPLFESSPAAIVIIDAGIEDYQTLVDGVVAGSAVVVLELDRDGVEQITEILACYPAIASLHIVSHGSPGCLYLGSSELSFGSIDRHWDQLEKWGAPHLHLYGCNVAAGDAGSEFVNKLQTITRASIAASSRLIGNAAKGGNWELDHRIGNLSADLPFTQQALEIYSGILATVDVAGQLLKFNETSQTLIAGSGTNVGTIYKYTNIITVGGVQVDALVQVVGITNATIVTFDGPNPNTPANTPYTVPASPSGTQTIADSDLFAPSIATSAPNGHVDFKISFQDTSGNPLTLTNFYSNSIDIDGTEFVDYTGFQSYELSSPATDIAVGAATGSQLDFKNATAGTYPNLAFNDIGRTQLKFTSVSSLTFSAGTTTTITAPGRLYGSIFAFIPFTTASVVVDAPTVNTLITNDTTPSITGTVGNTALGGAETFAVTVNGNTYNKGNANLVITGTNWTLNVPTVTAQGTYDVSVTRSGFLDDQTTQELTIDTTPPTVAIALSDTALIAGETSTVTFTFSEAPTGFAAADITSPNGTISGLAVTANPLVYSATFTPTANIEDPTNVITVAAASYTDTAGNNGGAGTSLNYTIDTLPPSVAITLSDAALTHGETSTVTFTFNEAPIGFTTADITAPSGTITGLAVTADPKVYTATFTPTANFQDATNVITVAAASYTDAAGNLGALGTSANYTVDTVDSPPVLDLDQNNSTTTGNNYSATFTENGAAVAIADSDILITDPDDANLASATVTLTNPFSGDFFNFNGVAVVNGTSGNATGITGITYNVSADGSTLTFSGSATKAQYQSIIRAIAFSNSSNNPNTTSRTITTTVNDGLVNSNTATSTIAVTAVNDKPVIDLNSDSNSFGETVNPLVPTGDRLAAPPQSEWEVLFYAGHFGVPGSSAPSSKSGTGAAGTPTLHAESFIGQGANTFTFNTGGISDTQDPVAPTAAANGIIFANNSTNGAYSPAFYGNSGIWSYVLRRTIAEPTTITLGKTGDVFDDFGEVYVNGTRISPAILAFTGSINAAQVMTTTVNPGDIVEIRLSNNGGPGGFTTQFSSPGLIPDSSFTNTYIEGAAPINVVGTASDISDLGENDITNLKIAVGNLKDGAAETLVITDATAAVKTLDLSQALAVPITVQFGATTFKISYDGTNISVVNNAGAATPMAQADLDTFIRALTYRNTSDAPTVAARTLTFTLTDSSGAVGNAAVSTINVTPTNDPPAIDLNGAAAGSNFSATYTENAAAVAIADATAATIADPDGTDIGTLSITVTGLVDGISEVLSIGGQAIALSGTVNTTATVGGTTFAISSTNGAITLTKQGGGDIPNADLQTLLRGITYQNTSEAPTAGNRTISLVANDGTVNSNTATSTITVTPVNDPPIVDLNGAAAGNDFSATYTENGTAVAIAAATTTVTDVDNANLASATVTLTNPASGDLFSFNGTPVSSGSTGNATGITGLTYTVSADGSTLTFSGSATQAQYQTALKSIAFANTLDNPTGGNRTITTVVNDGTANSAIATTTITIVPVNDPPAVDLNGAAAGNDFSATYTENGTAVAIAAPSVLITDPDNANIASATVVLTNAKANDQLTVGTLPSGITAAVDNSVAGQITITLTGSATQANYQTAINAITFGNTSDAPDPTLRTINVTVNDGTANSNTAVSSITVTPVNDAPVAVDDTFSMAEDGAPVTLALIGNDTDLEGNTLSAKSINGIALTPGTAQTISVTNGTVSVSATGVISFAPAANYNGAIAFDYVVQDGNGGEDTGTVNGTVTAVNDPPTIDLNGATTGVDYSGFFGGGIAVAIVDSTNATISDPDGADIESLTLSLTGIVDGANEILAIGGTAFPLNANATASIIQGSTTFAVTYTTATQTVSIAKSGGGDIPNADIQALLRNITYQNTNTNATTGDRVISIKANDGTVDSNTTTSTITIAIPTIAIASDKPALKAGGTATLTFTLSQTSTDFTAADITFSGGTLSGFTGSGTTYTATFTPASNSITSGIINVASNKFSNAFGSQNIDGADADNTVTLAIDTIPPTLTVVFQDADGRLNSAESNAATINGTTSAEAGQIVSLSISDGTNPPVTTTATVLANGTYSATGVNLSSLSSGTLTVTANVSDLAGNPATPALNTIVLDNVAPTITINAIALDDIINALEDDSAVAIAGTTTGVEDNQTVTVTLNSKTYTTTVTSNAWTVSVPAADAQALPATNTVTADVSDLAGNPAIQATHTVAHDAIAPTITINAIATDDIINALEDDSPVAIAGTTTGVEDGRTLTVTLHGITYTTTVTGNAWTVNVPAADAQALNPSETVTANVSDAAGNPAVQATHTVAHDAIAPTITINAIATDDIINAVEDQTPIAITGTTTGVEDGRTLTVTLNGKTYTATVTSNAWTVSVPAADAQALPATNTVTADVSDAAGNPAIQATHPVAHDAIAPTITINAISADDIINVTEDDSPVAIAGTTTGVEDGRTLTVTLNGKTYTTTVTSNAWTVSVPAADAQALPATNTVTADVSDLAGNPAVQATHTVAHDTIAPTVAITLSDAALKSGDTSTVTFTFSEVPTGFDPTDITAPNGTISGFAATADPLVYTALFTPTPNTEDPTNTITVSTGYTDAAGNPGTVGTSANYTIDTIAPTIAINAIATDDIINALEDKAPVAITGTTTGVEDGQTVTVILNGKTYTATVTSNAWTVSVPAADAQTLPASNPVTADVSDLAGNPAVQATHTVTHDAIAPTIVINPISTDDIINVTEDKAPVAIGGTTTGVEDGQTLTVKLHGISYTTTVTGNVWTVNVPAADAQALNPSETVTADVSDAAGNPAVQATRPLTHDAIAPTITINAIATDDIINAVEDQTPVAIAGTTTGVEDGRTLTLTLNGKTYTTTVTSNAWTVSVPAADAQALPATNTVTADVTDLAGNPAIQATHTVAHDAIAPTITINAIATDDIINAVEDQTPVAIAGTTTGVEDGRTLTLTLNGKTYTTTVTSNAWTVSVPAADAQALPATNTVTADVSDLAGNPAVQATHAVAHDAIAPTIVINAIATDDIINATEDQTPVAITGTTTGVEDGRTLTLTLNGKTYTTTVTSNAWTVSVPAADAQALPATNTVTADVSDLAGNPAVQATHTVAHDAIAPTITINAIATDDIINAVEDQVPVAITGTTTGVEDGRTLTVTLNGKTYTTTVTSNAWTVSVPAADAQVLPATNTVTADVSDLAGNPAIQATHTVAHDAIAPTITINAIATDDIINALEDDSPVAIAGTTTGVEDGRTLTVTLHGITYTTTVTGNAWTVNVPAADAQALNPSETVTANVSDAAGNPAVQATHTVAHDAIAPTIVINPISTNDIINAAEDDSPVAIAGTTTGVEDGRTLTVTLHGITYTTLVTGNAWTVNVPAADAQALNASEVVTADVSDVAGNPAVQATRTIAHDTTAPTIVINPISTDDIINAAEDDSPVAIAGTTTGVEDGRILTVTLHGTTYTTPVTGNAWTVNVPAADAQALNASEVVTADVSDLAGNPAVQATHTVTHDAIAPTVAITLSDAALKSGETSTVTFTFSEVPTGFDPTDITAPNGTISGLATTANPLVYTALFTPTPNIEDPTNVIMVSTGYTDAAGNPGTVGTSANYTIDTIAPTIVINPIATDDIINALEDKSPVAIGGTTTGVEDGQTVSVKLHGVTYTTTVTGNAWSLNVPATDAQALNASEVVTADVSDLAGNPAVQATHTVAHDAIVPTIIINPIATDDIINALEDDSPVAIGGTTTGVEDGQTLTVKLHGISYTTTVTGNAWTVNVPAADAQALNPSETVTADVSDAAGNPAVQATRPLTHDAIAPTITINAIATDDIINAVEDQTPVAIAGTTTGVEDGRTLTLTLNGKTYTTTVTSNAWTVSVPAADAQVLPATNTVTADVSDLAGNPAVQATHTVAHDAIAPTITINAIATDDIINAVEDQTPVAIAGTTTGVEDGRTLTLTLNGKTYTTTVTSNAWTVSVPAADAQALPATNTVTADVTDLAGNPAIQATHTVAHDAIAPTITINAIATDDIINAVEDQTPVAIAGTTTGVEDGRTLTLTLNGKTYTTTVTSNAWTVSVPAADAQALPATNTVTADVSDLAGNPAVQATHAVAHDAIAPTIVINAIATDDIINATEDQTPVAITGTTTGVEDGRTLTLTLNGKTYTTTVTSNAWTVSVPAADAQALPAANTVTADVSDLAGNPAIQATHAVAHDAIAPTITINAIATDDIINATEDQTPVAITGTTTGVEDGRTLTLTLNGKTYTTTVTSNAWTVSVPAADAQALPASNTVTADVSDLAGNPAIQATHTVAHDAIAPTIVINPIATDDIINALEDNSPVAIGGTTTGVEDGQTLTVTLHGLTYTTTVTGNAWTVNVPAADAQALNPSETVTADVSDLAGNPAVQATRPLTHDAIAPTIVINPIATDDIINAIEDKSPVAIGGTTTGVEDGRTLTVTLHGITYTATVTGNAWTVNVPATDAQALNPSETVTADVSDLAGNPAVQATRPLTHDAIAPTIVINPIATDDIINAIEDKSPVAIGGTTTGVEDGQTLTVTLHGITYTTTVTGNVWTLNIPATDAQALNASETVTADVSDSAGNPAVQATRPLTHDAIAPTIVINPIATDDIINALEDDSPVAIGGTTTGVEDGQTLTVTLHGITYTTTVTGNVWTLNIPAADAQALNASETVTADVSDLAGNPAVQATRPITHDAIAPTIVINPIATDDIINALEDDSPVAIAGTTTGVEDGQTLTVTLHGITYTTTVTGNAWTVSVPATDAQALNPSETVTADVSDLAGNPAVQATRPLTHDATAPTIVINPIATDDIVNALEDDSPVAIAGTTTGVEDGQTLTVTLHGITYTTTVTGNAWTVSVPAADAQALNPSETVTANVSDLAGNPAVQATRPLTHDAIAPTIVINPIATDDIINALEDDSPVAIGGTTTGVEDGQTLTVTLHGITYTTTVTGNAWTVSVPATDAQALNPSETVTADVSDLAGNPAVQATRPLTHDAIAPTIVINPIATDDIINALEDDSPVAIGGTTTGVEDGQTLTVTLHGITYTTTVTGNAWTVSVPATDAQALNPSETVTADVSDLAGNPATQATRTVTHDAIAPTIVINPIATDDIINALEDDSPVAIGGITTGVEDGQTLTVTLHGITYTTTVTGNTWTVNVPATDAQALNPSETVTADVSNLAGNPAIQVTRTLAHDAIAPTIVINPIATDDIINALEDDSPVAIAGTTTGVEDGQTLTVTLHGIPYTTTVTGNVWSLNVPAADAQALNASETVTADVSDLAGNPAVQATRAITHDVIAPTIVINAIATDDIINALEDDFPVAIGGTTTGVEDGQTLTVTLHGITYTTTVTGNAWTVSVLAADAQALNPSETVTAGVSDLAGNPAVQATRPLTHDAIAPTIVINPIATDDIINALEDDSPVTIGGTTTGVEDGQTLTVTLHGITYTTTVTGNAWTVNVPATDAQALNPSEVVTVDVSDLAGNPAVQATRTLAHDTTAPTIVINPIATDDIINALEDNSPIAIGGTTTGVEDGQTLTVTLHGITYTTTVTGNAWTLNVPAADAQALNVSEIVTADVSDLAGNPATQATHTVTHDAIAPTIVINPIATDDIINALEDDSPVAIGGTTTGVEDGQTLTVTLHGISYTTTVAGNAWTVNVPAPDAQALNASETVTVNVSDASGNPAVPVTRAIAHDAIAPVVSVDPLVTNDSTPKLTGKVDDPTAVIRVTVNGQTYTATNNGDGTWTLADNTIATALADGSYDVTAVATDVAGNVGTEATTQELSIDATAPTVTVGVLTTKDATPALTGIVSDPTAVIRVTVNGQPYTATNNGDGTWTLVDNTIATALADGTYDISVTATDTLGNVGTDATTSELTIDTTAPVVTVKPTSTNDGTPKLVGTINDPTAGVTVTVNGQTYTATNNGDGTWTLADNTIATPLPDGTYDVTVVATDTVGNAGTDPTSQELIVNSKAPTVTIDLLSTNDATPQLTGTVSDSTAVVKLTVNGQTYTATNNGNGTWTLPDNTIAAPLPDGIYDIAASASDPLGNTGTDTSLNELILDATAPAISVDPLITVDSTPQLSGKVDDPTAVVSVTVNGQTYAATNNGDGTWILPDNVIPSPLPDGTYDVVAVATDAFGNAGTDATTQDLTVSVNPPIVSIDPLTTSDRTPKLTGKVSDPQSVVTIILNGQTYTTTNNGDGTWTLPDDTVTTPLPDGTYDIVVSAMNTLGKTGTDTTSNELTITPGNQVPIAQDANNTVIPGKTVAVSGLGATDSDGSIVSYTIVTLPDAAQGSLFLGDPAAGGSAVTTGQVLTPTQVSQLYFRASSNFSAASLSYTATDNQGATDPSPAIATFSYGNLPPVSVDFTPAAPIQPGAIVPITGLSATDPDGTIASYTITTLPDAAQGTLYLGDPRNGGTLVSAGQVIQPQVIAQLFFKAASSFTGTAFTYTTTDNKGAIDPKGGRVTLGVSRALEEYCPNQPGVIRSGSRRKNTLVGTDNRDRLLGKGGNDKLRGGASEDILLGGRGNDKLFGDACSDLLRGGLGNDKLKGGTGNDRLRGDRGNDKLWGDAGNDKLWGGQGNDKLKGGTGNDKLSGGLGKDRLFGNAGDDSLSGGRGNDRLKGGTGNDKLKGGTGKDKLLGGSGNDTLSGGRGNDTLKGGSERDRLVGNRGNDWLGGGKGNDSLKGGIGNDRLWGGRGQDVLLGGTGNDRLLGRQGNDKLDGGRGNDRLKGDGGRDVLKGKQGNDILIGGKQSDKLVGGFGDDQIYGNRGADILKGGFGHDLLSGGQGNDRFVYTNPQEKGDRITDFKPNQDAIDLSGILSKKQFASAKPFRDYVKLIQSGASTIVQLDANGKAAGGFETLVTLDNVAINRLNADSFIL